jgi:hypothetical protein
MTTWPKRSKHLNQANHGIGLLVHHLAYDEHPNKEEDPSMDQDTEGKRNARRGSDVSVKSLHHIEPVVQVTTGNVVEDHRPQTSEVSHQTTTPEVTVPSLEDYQKLVQQIEELKRNEQQREEQIDILFKEQEQKIIKLQEENHQLMNIAEIT